MSGRSAHVRKKITETKLEGKTVQRPLSKPSADSDDHTIVSDYPVPSHRQDLVGVGTTNARFLKFSEPVRETEAVNLRSDAGNYGNHSTDSQSGGSSDGRRDTASQFKGPLEDFAYARARRPVIKTEDVSGIEKSGLRNMLDKKSDEVRKGLAKTFTFRKHNKDKRDFDRVPDLRPQSSATVRPTAPPYHQEHDNGYDSYVDAQQSQPSHHANNNVSSESTWDGPAGGFASAPPSTKLPPVPAGAPPIKRWIGAGRPVQRWNKLRKDPELWDPNGDVFVFFGHKGQTPRPNPSFRLSSHIIEATESRYLITLLREGSTDEDINMPPSPAGAPPLLQRYPHAGSGGHQPHVAHHLAPHSAGYGNRGQPTPPISEDTSLAEADGQISYEMYFPTPANLSRVDQLRHHITTRNVFALLYHASLVGLSLYQALSDLNTRLDSYMPPESDNIGTILDYLSARGIDDVRNDPETAVSLLAWAEGPEVRWEEGWRESFLHCAGMYGRLEAATDFRNVTPITRALLERASLETQLRVQAAEERLAEFQYGDMWPSSVATTASTSGPVGASPAKGAADRLQRFLAQHYTRVYGRWPPLPPLAAGGGRGQHHGGGHDVPIGTAIGGGEDEDDVWLTRTVTQALQRDFAALYDFLVNRDVVWDGSEARSGRKWMMVSESGNRAFEADTPDLPMTDMLIEFDNKLRFPHIPHPYPLVPESIPPPRGVGTGTGANGKDGSSGGGVFGGSGRATLKKTPSGGASTPAPSGVPTRSNATERRIQLAYTEATNICILGSDFTHSDLIDAFGKFEKADRVGDVDPSVARRGRWVLVYGVLQTLASVSVDAPNARYRDDVPYHLSPRLKSAKIPPWKTAVGSASASTLSTSGAGSTTTAAPDEAAHELSHCWTAPRAWNGDSNGASGSNATNSGADSSAASSDGSGNTSPVARSYRGFPRPPPSTASRNSIFSGSATGGRGGAYQRGSRSAAFGSTTASSIMSDNGDVPSGRASVAGSRTGSTSARKSHRSRDNLKAMTAAARGGGIERVDENDWPPRGQSYANYTHSHGAATSAVGGNGGAQAASGQPSSGGFLVLDDVVDDSRSFTTAVSGKLGTGRSGSSANGNGAGSSRENVGYGRPLLSRGSSESESITPVIRDFDDLDLDVIDDHEP